MEILGIDIGGSGIKGAPVNIKKGKLLSARHRFPTPTPSTPDAVGDTVAEIVKHFDWRGAVGCTFPAVVQRGIVHSAANVDKSWIEVDGRMLLEEKTDCPVLLLNDADAAGLAEMEFGAGKKRNGVVLVLTLGTGIGSAFFIDGKLMPNTELGHMLMMTRYGSALEAEDYASDRARQEDKLKWKPWARRLDEFLATLEALFSPDLFIIGGGVSKKHQRFLPLLNTRAEVVPARLLNEAGIVGAALAAQVLVKRKK